MKGHSRGTEVIRKTLYPPYHPLILVWSCQIFIFNGQMSETVYYFRSVSSFCGTKTIQNAVALSWNTYSMEETNCKFHRKVFVAIVSLKFTSYPWLWNQHWYWRVWLIYEGKRKWCIVSGLCSWRLCDVKLPPSVYER